MRQALITALLLATAAGSPYDTELRRFERRFEPRDKTPDDPLIVTCPTCKAEPGQGCNRATLGRYRFHKARVDAFEEYKNTPPPLTGPLSNFPKEEK